MPSGGGTMMPFRVSTDFDLGLFLKNEKSTLKLGDRSSSALHKSPTFQGRFRHVDNFVTSEYWSLDLEFLISCIVPLLWSVSGLYLINELLPNACFDHNHTTFALSSYLFSVNAAEQLISLVGLLCAKYSENWHVKINLLNIVIGVKLVLTSVNFLMAINCFVTQSCGFWYAKQLMEDLDVAEDVVSSVMPTAVHSPQAEDIGAAIINGFRYYDVKIVGLDLVFASVGQCVGAMLLLVKRNDIKMYVLWRLGKLDQYIDDLHTRQ